MTMLSGPTEVSYGQLAAVKGAIKLEKIGMKSRGGSLRTRWAETLGLKPRDKHDVFIAAIQQRMDNLIELRRAELVAG